MPKQPFHLCVVQIACHPSADVNDLDPVSEPQMDSKHSIAGFKTASMAVLPGNHEVAEPLQESQDLCKREYIEWAGRRLEGILEWLSGQHRRPDVVAFPEGSLPLPLLPAVKIFVAATGCAVFAGSHRYSVDDHALYPEIGFTKKDLTDFAEAKETIVIPVFERLADGTVACHLRGKKYLSPPEQPTHFVEKPEVPLSFPPMLIQTPSGPLRVVPLVCSEALQRQAISHEKVDLVVISSYQSASKVHYFDAIKDCYVRTKVPVMYANDGNPGQSEIATLWDNRRESWFAHTGPLRGTLPAGDAILILETYPGNLVAEMGAATPEFPTHLVKLASITADNTLYPDYQMALLLRELRTAMDDSDTEAKNQKRKLFIKQLQGALKGVSPLLEAKGSRLLALLEREAPSPAILNVHCDECIVREGMSLPALEQRLCKLVLPWVESARPAQAWKARNQEHSAFEYHLNLCSALRHKASHSGHSSQLVSLAHAEIGRKTADAHDHAIKSLNHRLGSLLEKFQATSSLLEIAKKGGDYLPLITHNLTADRLAQTTALLRRKSEHINNNCPEFPGFNRAWSLISCLVLPPGSQTPIGRITLVANYGNAFLPSQLGQLEAESHALDVDLLIVHSIEQDKLHGWHPEIDGWNARSLLNSLCFRLSTLGHDHSITTYLSITLWIFDRSVRRAYARGTAHFDYEYETERCLPLDKSFIGSLSDSKSLHVIHGDPREVFHRRIKATRMEIKHVFAVPVFIGGLPGGAPVGSLSVYLFGGRSTDEKSGREREMKEDMIELSRIIGAVIADFERMRALCARATVNHRLTREAVILSDGFQTLLKIVLKLLHAEAGTIFAAEDDVLKAVASTGLTDEAGHVLPLDECVYVMDGTDDPQVGLTQHCARHPDTVIRLNNISDSSAFPTSVRSSNRYREIFPLSEATYRRYLGCAVTGEDGRLLGVIRVLRRATAQPFIEADEHLIRTVCQEGQRVFALHACARTHPGVILDPGVAAGRLRLPWAAGPVSDSAKLAATRLLRPILPNESTNECEVRSIIQDLHCLFRDKCAIVVRLGLVKQTPAPNVRQFISNQFLCMQHSLEQPVEEDFQHFIGDQKSIAIHCVESMKACFYYRACSLYVPFHERAADVVGGICIPFELEHCRWEDGTPQVAVLTVEFEPNDENREKDSQLRFPHIETLLCTIVKLSRIGLKIDTGDLPRHTAYALCKNVRAFQEMITREASGLGLSLVTDFPPIVRGQGPNLEAAQTLSIGPQPVGSFRVDGEDAVACRQFAADLRKYWTTFLNGAMGTHLPWYVSDYLPELDDSGRGMQPIDLGIGWNSVPYARPTESTGHSQ